MPVILEHVRREALERYHFATKRYEARQDNQRGQAVATMEDWAATLIREARVATLGTLDREGRPHLVPVCYATVGNAFVIAIDEKPKRPGTLARIRNILRDPRCTLLIQRYDDADWQRLAWVRVEGMARVATHGAHEPEALAALRGRYPQYRTMDLETRELILVTPTRVVSWRWAGP